MCSDVDEWRVIKWFYQQAAIKFRKKYSPNATVLLRVLSFIDLPLEFIALFPYNMFITTFHNSIEMPCSVVDVGLDENMLHCSYFMQPQSIFRRLIRKLNNSISFKRGKYRLFAD